MRLVDAGLPQTPAEFQFYVSCRGPEPQRAQKLARLRAAGGLSALPPPSPFFVEAWELFLSRVHDWPSFEHQPKGLALAAAQVLGCTGSALELPLPYRFDAPRRRQPSFVGGVRPTVIRSVLLPQWGRGGRVRLHLSPRCLTAAGTLPLKASRGGR